MGHYTGITIAKAEGLSVELIGEAAGNHMQGALNEPAIAEPAAGNWHVSGETRWEPEGVEDFAAAISARFPSAVIEVRIEWDTEDADEAGSTEYSYIAGERCNVRENGLVPDDLGASVKRVRDALTGSGDLESAARWLVDGLEGTRIPVPDAPSEPRRVVKVTVIDGWGNDYSDLFAAAFSYAEVTERNGEQLLTAAGWHDDRQIVTEKDVSDIIRRWIEHAQAATGSVYTWHWMGGWNAYAIPFWDGKSVGLVFIDGTDDGDGHIAFGAIADALCLNPSVTWSDGTTD